MTSDRPDNMPDPSPQAPAGMSWSGLFACAADNLSALRLHQEYTDSDLYRAKVDSLARCVNEAISRLEAMKCLPAPGEPSFMLLGRDPQAPARVRDWVIRRRLANDQSPNAQRKITDAIRVADAMDTWKLANPGLGLPISLEAPAAPLDLGRVPSPPRDI